MRNSSVVNWLCAAFEKFVYGLAGALALAYVAWTLLGWLAAIFLSGTAEGDAALAVWLSFVLASAWLLMKEDVESWIDRVDQRIEARAHAWKNR